MHDTHSNEPSSTETREQRIGQILNDLLDRQKRGEAIGESSIRAEHPHYADELLAHLGVLEGLKQPGDIVPQLIRQGMLRESPDPHYAAALGDFLIVDSLGGGGMGVVLRARQECLNRTVALKLLRPELVHDDRALKRFTREAKAAGGLKHPHIVTLHETGETSGTHYLAMECVEGPSLAELIRSRGPLSADTARDLFRQVLSGLEAAHDAGVVHRDIKSSNILLQGAGLEQAFSRPAEAGAGPEPQASACAAPRMLRRRGIVLSRLDQNERGSPRTSTVGGDGGRTGLTAKIADFGLARMATAQSRMTMPDSVLGTPEYMSPEQARGDDRVDHRADLYSAGVVLYEMLTGRTPFKADKASGVIHQILNMPPPDPRTLSDSADPVLSSLALRLMAKQPEDRFESAAAALDALTEGGRVRSIERRRSVRRAIASTVLLAAAVLFALRLLTPAPLDMAEVVRGQPGTIELSREGTEETYRIVPFHGKKCSFTEVELLDLHGTGRHHIVARTVTPVDGVSLFVFDANGELAGKLVLPEPGSWEEAERLSQWKLDAMSIGDVDGESGDEVVVVASDVTEYPGLLALIDPRSQQVRPVFWHQGHLSGVRIIGDFFDQERPALLAWGMNDKMDGFGKPHPVRPYLPRNGEHGRPADYTFVQAVMILDPMDMEGCGPPRSRFSAARRHSEPHAYAMVNLPCSERAWLNSDVVDVYDCETGMCVADPLRHVRADHAATSVGDKAIIAGALDSNVIEIYELPAAADLDGCGFVRTKDTIAELRHGLAATTCNGTALFAGGYTGGGGGGYVSKLVDAYTADTEEWSTKELSAGRQQLAAASACDKAFFAGGMATDFELSSAIDVIDCVTWNRVQLDLSIGRDRIGATAVGNEVLFAGGHVAGGATDVVDIFNCETLQRTVEKLSEARTGIAATTVGALALFAGGDRHIQPISVSDSLDVYDSAHRNWSVDRIPLGRCNMAAASACSKAVFAGGMYPVNGEWTLTSRIDVLDVSTGQWSVENLSQPREGLVATAIGNKIIFAGGNTYGAPSRRLQSGSNPPADPDPEDVISILDIETIQGSTEPGIDLAFRIHVTKTLAAPRSPGREFHVLVDRHLNLLRIEVTDADSDRALDETWSKAWMPIIQDGEYVSQ